MGVSIRSIVAAARALLEAVLEGADGSSREALHELHTWLGKRLERLPASEGQRCAEADVKAETAHYEPRILEIGGQRIEIAARIVEGDEPLGPEQIEIPVERKPSGTPSRRRRPFAPDEIDLRRVIARAELKAEAARFEIERRRGAREADPAEEQAALERAFAAARELADCDLWMLKPQFAGVEDEVVELAGHAYGNLALAARILRAWEERSADGDRPDEDSLYLAAEAQSALRAILLAADYKDDADQLEVFGWLRKATSEHRIYIERHLRLRDPADPTEWHDLRARLVALEERLEEERRDRRERRKLADRVTYRAGRLRAANDGAGAGEWAALLKDLCAWVESGRPPSSREICDPLLEIVDDLPEEVEVPAAARRVLDAIDARIASMQRSKQNSQAAVERETTEEVRRVAAGLRGKVVLLIGGQARPFEKERLERDFELAELRWLSTRAHRSIQPLENAIRAADVALVIVAVRWSDHSFASLKQVADEADKPLVRLPRGYGTNQVAHEILGQVSEKLGL